MKKNMIVLAMLLLWASPAAAQQAGGARAAATPVSEVQALERLEEFDASAGPLYHSMSLDRNIRAGEYEYIKNSAGGVLDLEWDPLPQRLKVEGIFLNQKDYFSELDYAYRDVIVVNVFTRAIYHNLDHHTFGADDPTTTSPSSVDRNPDDVYGLGTQMNRAFLRLKAPDFPFHIYVDARTIDKEGTIQQRFMRGYAGGLSRVSQSRDVDRNTQDVTIGTNTHLGPIEADYSHNEKKYRELDDKTMYDAYTTPSLNVPHNTDPDLKQRSDTIKLHTAYTGRIVLGGTLSNGEKRNLDSGAKANFHNSSADLTLLPHPRLLLAVKYRHYDMSVNNPDTVTTLSPIASYNVRDSIASKRDLMIGTIRYRITSRLSVKGEYTFDTSLRDAWHGADLTPLEYSPIASGTGPNSWLVATRTTKGTARMGVTYLVMNRVTARADYSVMQVTNPAYAMDPDRSTTAKTSITWMPAKRLTALVSYSGVREKRDNLSAPLAGGNRKSDRDQSLASLTMLVGKRSSVTASYYYYSFKNKETLTYRDAVGAFTTEEGVPYADKTQVASLAFSTALVEGAQFVAEASRGLSQGRFRNNGTVANTTDIAELSDMRVIEDDYSAGLELQFGKRASGELRFQQRHYDDKIDSTQSGTVRTTIATVSAKW